MKKIFGIGLPKTGQTSLAWAMKELGYTTVQYPYKGKQIREKDFANDLTVTIQYKKLDKLYPHSKFILTTRAYNKWIKSMRNHYRRFPASKRYPQQLVFREKFWGTKNFNTRIMTEKYFAHLEDVEKYFKWRKRSLLIMDIEAGDGWKELCKFLGKKIPRKPFPKRTLEFIQKKKKLKK